jgi:DNA-binding NtrC family response regulator
VEHSQFDSYMGERAEHERWRQEGLREFRPLREVESELLLHAEELCQGNRKEMAKILGLSEATIYRRLAVIRRKQRQVVSQQVLLPQALAEPSAG